MAVNGAPISIVEGGLIAGRFRIGRVLGAGAMGAVFAAIDEHNGQPCAIKVIHPHVARAGVNAERFRREVTLAQQLGHPGIVRVYDAGHDQNAGLFMVMELLQGVTFRLPLSQGDLTVAQSLEVTSAMLDALQAAHHAGIVHRDLKPDNIFLHAPDGQMPQVKLLDFGVARHRNTAGLTTTNVGLGTPHFMAPEQATDARSVTPASDVWSAGVILYYIFSGALPFDGDGPYDTVLRACTEKHVPLNERVPELDYRFVDIVEMCLEKDPVERFQDAGELFEVLVPLVEDPRLAGALTRTIAAEPKGVDAETSALREAAVMLPSLRPPPSDPPPSDPPAAASLEPVAAAAAPARRASRWPPVLAALTLAVLAFVGWQVGFRHRVLKVEPLTPTADLETSEAAEGHPPPLPVPRALATSAPATSREDEPPPARPERRATPTRRARLRSVPKRVERSPRARADAEPGAQSAVVAVTADVPRAGVPRADVSESASGPLSALADTDPATGAAAKEAPPVAAAEADLSRPPGLVAERDARSDPDASLNVGSPSDPAALERVAERATEAMAESAAARVRLDSRPTALVRTATRAERPMSPARQPSQPKPDRAKEPVEPDFVTF